MQNQVQQRHEKNCVGLQHYFLQTVLTYFVSGSLTLHNWPRVLFVCFVHVKLATYLLIWSNPDQLNGRSSCSDTSPYKVSEYSLHHSLHQAKAVVVVNWSVYFPSAPTIWVRILGPLGAKYLLGDKQICTHWRIVTIWNTSNENFISKPSGHI